MSPTAKVSGEAGSAAMWRLGTPGLSAAKHHCHVTTTARGFEICWNKPRGESAHRARRARQQRGDTMTLRSNITIASTAAALAALAVAAPVSAGGDKVAFPEDHEAGVLFTTDGRADDKQLPEVYTSAATSCATMPGVPRP